MNLNSSPGFKKLGRLPKLKGKARSSTKQANPATVDTVGTDEENGGDGATGESIVHLETKVEQFKEERARMVDYMGGIQRNYLILAKSCSDAQREVDSLNDRLKEQKTASDQYLQEIESLHLLKGELKSERERNEELVAASHDLQLKLRETMRILEDRNHRLQEAVSSNEGLEVEVVRLKEAAQRNHSQVIVSQQQLQDDQTLILRRERRCMQLEGMLSDRNNEINELSERVRSLEVAIQKSDNVCRRAVMDRDNLKLDHARVKSNSLQLEVRFRDASARLEEAEQVKKGLIMDLKAMKSRATTLADLPSDIQSRYDKLQSLCQHLQLQLDRSVEVGKESESELQLVRQQLAQARTRTSSALADLTALVAEYELLKERLSATNDILDEARVEIPQLIEKAQQLASVQLENKDLRSMVDDVQRQRALWIADIGKALDASKGHEKMFAELEASNKRLKEDHDSIRSKYSAALADRDSLQKLVKDKADERNKFEREATRLREAMIKMKSDFEKDSEQLHCEVNATLGTLRHQIQDLNSKLAEKTALLKELQSPENLTMQQVKIIKEQQKELKNTIAKLVNAEEASEPAFTCYNCMRAFTSPVTCIPCGHSYCEACLVSAGHCKQCGESVEISFYPNRLLGELSAKYAYRKQVLQGLLDMETVAHETNPI